MRTTVCIWTLAAVMVSQGLVQAQENQRSAKYKQMAFDYLGWVQTNPKPEYLSKVEDIVSETEDEQIHVVATRTVPGLVRSGADAGAAVDLLSDMYDDSDSARVKRSALVALSSVRTLDSFDAILSIAEGERDERLRERAFWALRRIAECEFPDIPAFWYQWREGQWRLSREVMTEVESGEADRILGAMASTTQLALPSPELMDLVSSFLYDLDPVLREGACKTLAVHHGYPMHVRTRLVDMAEGDVDTGVRKAALSALGKEQEKEGEAIASR